MAVLKTFKISTGFWIYINYSTASQNIGFEQSVSKSLCLILKEINVFVKMVV